MNYFKRLIAATMAAAMITSTFVTGFATAVAAKAPAYTIQMIGNTLTLMKNGVAFMPYRLSTVAGADAVKVTQTATGEVRLSFVDSTGKARLIEIGKEANLEIKGTFPALVIDKSVTNTTVALAAYNKNDRNAIPTIIKDLQVNGVITLQIPVGAEVQKATVSNKDTKVDIAKGSDVKNVTVAEGVVVGGTGSSDTNVSTDTNLGDGSTSGGSTSGGSGSSGGSNSGDDESDNEPTQYTVTFKDSGNKTTTLKVNKGAKIPADKIPSPGTVDGKIFIGWFLIKGNTENKWNLATSEVTNNITLTAKFAEPVTVTFKDSGVKDNDVKDSGFAADSERSITIGKGTALEDGMKNPTDKTEYSYTFEGWFADGATKAWDKTAIVTKDLILTAQYKKIVE